MILVEDTPKHTVEDMGSRMMAVRLLLPVLVAQVTQSVLASNTSPETYFCRNRGTYQNMTTFALSSCSSCYGFLFPVYKELRSADTWLISINGIHFKHLTYLVPDIHDTASRDMICQTLNHNECSDWLHCCKDAEKCCEKNKLLADEVHTQIFNTSICPETWDGFACWDETRAKSIAVSQCPTFIQHGNPSQRAEKSCTANGSWYTQQSGREWTDYTKCFELSDYTTQSISSVACNIASLLVLLPSIAISLVYRVSLSL